MDETLNDIYEKLRIFLDEITPCGVQETPEGDTKNWLQTVYTPEEARLIVQLTLKLEPAADIAVRWGKAKEETITLLENLIVKGLIDKRNVEGGEPVYAAMSVNPGWIDMLLISRSSDPDFIAKTWEFCFKTDFLPRQIGMKGGQKTLMTRAIPVEAAVSEDAAGSVQSYEKITEIIKNAPKPIVIYDCTCRDRGRMSGDSCKRVPVESCIGFGIHGEFHLRNKTGKEKLAREVTVEEALAIVKITDEAGCVHRVAPNVTDPKDVAFLCNCCPCHCAMFLMMKNINPGPDSNITAIQASNFLSEIDEETCIGCSKCLDRCPVGAITKDVDMAHCGDACPAHIDVPGYIALAGAGKIREAYQLIRRENPFPSVCGRICTHPCESKCSRSLYDESIGIVDVKRYVSDYAFDNGLVTQELSWPKNGKRVGIIGAGPSGLSCAYYLALSGYAVDVYESQSVAGGVLTLGIPQYRLPKDILQRDIRVIEQTGVTIHLNTEVGKDITFDELKQKHDAVYVATGMPFSKKVGISGEELPGIYHGLDFLCDVNLDKKPEIGRKVVVIGGGNTAIDAARVAVRLGCKDVTILYRRRVQDMPADPREVAQAMEEGVKILSLAAPVALTGSGKVEAIQCVKMDLGKKDESGRRSTHKIEGSEYTIEADMVIPAVSQYSDLPFIPKDQMKVTEWGNFVVDGNLMTTTAGVFAGGDIVRGSDVAITAIADGKQAAQSIHVYLGGEGVINKGAEIAVPERPDRMNEIAWEEHKRSEMRCVAAVERKGSFAEVPLGLTPEQVTRESQRCFGCTGTVEVTTRRCIGCGLCVSTCPVKAIKLGRRPDYEMADYPNTFPALIEKMRSELE